MCEGSNRYIHPTKAKAKDGKWKYIYQRKESKKETQLKPLVYIEECLGVYMKFPYLLKKSTFIARREIHVW